MKWFKHDTDANMDAKLQEILLDYGLEGYGLYWYCLELIAHSVTSDKLTFELEHDCRIIARNTGSSIKKVQEIMTKFIELELFDGINGRVVCLSLSKRCDDFTAKAVRRTGVQPLNLGESDKLGQTRTFSEKVPLEVEVEVEVEVEKKRDTRKRETQLSEDFKVTKEMAIWAVENKAEHLIVLETDKFKDYCISKGKTYKDWKAGWRNWIRNAIKYNQVIIPQAEIKNNYKPPAFPTLED